MSGNPNKVNLADLLGRGECSVVSFELDGDALVVLEECDRLNEAVRL